MSKRGLAVILICVLLISACVPEPTPAPATPDYSIPFTMAAQTAQVRGTMQAGETAVVLLTQLAAMPTLPPAPPTRPVYLPQTDAYSAPVETRIPPSPTLPSNPCYQAQLVNDFSVPFNALLPVGASFTKSWQIINTGSCPWTQQFDLVLSGGDPMGSNTVFPISTNIQPGETLNLSVGFIAPGFVGVHQSNWLLRSNTGTTFGVGINAATPLQVLIRTAQTQTANSATYDFSTKLCQAYWESGAGARACPGSTSDPGGSITLLDQASTESRQTSGLALLTVPNLDINGWMRGSFPAVTVRENDHFLAEIGCLNGSPNCRLIFQLDYQISGGVINRLGTWRENYDGQTTFIDLDLSGLAGRAVQFIFSVQNTGSANHANAFWLQPRLQNQTASGSLMLSWTRTGYPSYPCAELQVYLTSSGLGQAQAFSCSPNRFELGRAGLSALEVQELVSWDLKLRGFDAEINRNAAGSPIITWIKFHGSGTNDALDPDLQAINNFAAALFDAIAP